MMERPKPEASDTLRAWPSGAVEDLPPSGQTQILFRPIGCTEGAVAYRAVSLGKAAVSPHCHERASLTIPLLGSLATSFGAEAIVVQSTGAVFHPAGALHGGSFATDGCEAIEFEFEPDWLRHLGILAPDRTVCGLGGTVSAAALGLARAWTRPKPASGATASATVAFFDTLHRGSPAIAPTWLKHVQSRIRMHAETSTREIARDLGISANWLAEAYREAVGEGLQVSIRRRRVEAAALLLRNSSEPLAQIACQTGFCDQSHMTRVFGSLLGRTPMQVRRDRIRSARDGQRIA